MTSCLRMAFVIVVAAWVSACAGVKPIPLDHAQAGEIKTIGVVTPEMPEGSTSFVVAASGRAFGLVGALIEAGVQSSREQALDAALRIQKFEARQVFTDKLAEALKAKGYTVVMVEAKRPSQGEFLAKYPEAAQVDAYLDIVSPVWGYIAASNSSAEPFRPHVALKCRLVRPRDASVLMQDTVVYNPINQGAHEGVTLSAHPDYAFATSDMMDDQPEHVAEGLRVAMGETAAAIGVLLR